MEREKRIEGILTHFERQYPFQFGNKFVFRYEKPLKEVLADVSNVITAFSNLQILYVLLSCKIVQIAICFHAYYIAF